MVEDMNKTITVLIEEFGCCHAFEAKLLKDFDCLGRSRLIAYDPVNKFGIDCYKIDIPEQPLENFVNGECSYESCALFNSLYHTWYTNAPVEDALDLYYTTIWELLIDRHE